MKYLRLALLLSLAPLPCAAESQDIGVFIRTFLKNDPQISLSRETLRLREIEERRAGNRASSTLTLSPSYDYSRDRGLGGSQTLDDRQFSQSADYAHTAGFGTTFGANARYNNDNSSLYNPSQDAYSGQLSVSQPLWRNRFGRLWNLDRRIKGLDRASAEETHTNTTLARHLSAADIYSRAYTAQRKEAVFAELLENMRKLWEQTEKDYEKKLITKLNFLSVKSNWYEMLDTQERIETEKSQALQVLNLYTDAPWQDSLSSPATYFSLNPVAETPDLSSHPSVRAEDSRIGALRLKKSFIDIDNGPDLDLDGSLGYAHTSNPLAYAGLDKDNWTAAVGFKLALPIVNPETKYDDQANEAQIAAATSRRAEVLRALNERWKLRYREFRELVERAKLNESKTKVYELQIDEALRKFRQGRMEFQDYLQHWDRYENSKLSGLDLQAGLWTAQLRLLEVAGRLPATAR